METEHLPWIGSTYRANAVEDRILIVGFSHWGDYEPEEGDGFSRSDDPSFTINVFRRWVMRDEIRFFNSIADYFEAKNRNLFWDDVAFANTLPTSVGPEDNRYSKGTSEQRAVVEQRCLRLVEEVRPGRVFVFSKKAWSHWPNFTGSPTQGTLQGDRFPEIERGTSSAWPARDGKESLGDSHWHRGRQGRQKRLLHRAGRYVGRAFQG